MLKNNNLIRFLMQLFTPARKKIQSRQLYVTKTRGSYNGLGVKADTILLAALAQGFE